MDLFLENYSLDELSNMPLEDLANYLRMKGRNRFPNPEYVAKSIQKAVAGVSFVMTLNMFASHSTWARGHST